MADRPDVKTRLLTRDKLALICGDNHELIKAFENMQVDVAETLPNAIVDATADSGSVLAFAAFGRQVVAPPPPVDASSNVLASQIFGA